MRQKKKKPKPRIKTYAKKSRRASRRTTKNYREKKSKAPKQSILRGVQKRVRHNASRKRKKISRAPSRRKITTPKRAVGYSTKFKVQSRRLGREITIKRKETRIKSAKKLNAKSKGTITDNLISHATKHYQKLGKSKNNLFLLRLKYSATYKGKKITRYFSTKIAKLKNKKQLAMLLEITINDFVDSLQSYFSRGFSSVKITGVQVQGYE